MELSTATLSTLLAGLIAVWGLYRWYKRPRGMPPGPRGVPFLGTLPFLRLLPERVLFKWRDIYGPIMTVRFGREDWVIINDFKTAYKALVKSGDSFLSRPVVPVLEIGTDGHGLAILKYGDKWKIQRKFTIMTLRGFGMGKRSIEDTIKNEASCLCEEIRKAEGKPQDLALLFAKAVSNNTCSVVFGRRFDYHDPWLIRILQYVDKRYHDKTVNAAVGVMVLVPWLEHIPPFSGIVSDLLREIDEVIGMFKKEVEQHQATLQSNDVRDFIDAFLIEMNKDTESYQLPQLLHLIRELFEASTDTLTSTLLWTMMCLIHYPEAQDKLYKEIFSVLGSNGKPSFAMKTDLPHTSAFIQEVMRFRTLTPISALHYTNNTVEVEGFTIPKGTTVVPNLWAIHNDPNVWKNPRQFNPERHLDAEGRFIPSDEVISFSIGPRNCPGKQLAITSIYIFIISLVQKFEFVPERGNLPDIEKASTGFVYTPLPFKVIAKERGI